MMIDTHPYPRLIACTSTHSSFTLTGVFSLHAFSITRNLRTYFTSIRRTYFTSIRSLFSRDGRVADCTVRLLGAVHPSSRVPFGIALCERSLSTVLLKKYEPFLSRFCVLFTAASPSNSNNSLESNGGLYFNGDGGGSRASSVSSKMMAQEKRVFSEHAHQFVRRTLLQDPSKRSSIQTLLNSDGFIKQIKKSTSLFTTLNIQREKLGALMEG